MGRDAGSSSSNFTPAHPSISDASTVTATRNLQRHSRCSAQRPCRAHKLSDDRRARELALDALERIVDDRAAGNRAWGYPFDVQTRWSFYAAGTPNVVVTSFAARALLAAAEPLARADFGERALDAARWALDTLWVEPTGFFAYHPGSRVSVHNASLLGANLVHVALGDQPHARACVARAIDHTLTRQRSDGSFPYGEGDTLGWADSFHTGFVLGCLYDLRAVDDRIPGALMRGARHYASFFDADGRALLYSGRRFPEDAHSAGTGMSTLAALVAGGYADDALLDRVVRRTLSALVRNGSTVARRHRWGHTRVWYPRWCDAHVALGLVDAAAVLARSELRRAGGAG